MTGTPALPEPGSGTNPGGDLWASLRPGPRPALVSSLSVGDALDSAVRGLDEQLAAHDVPDPNGSLRATVCSALAVASGVPEYDVAIAAARGRVAVRIRHSDLGLEVHVVELDRPAGALDAGSPVHSLEEP